MPSNETAMDEIARLKAELEEARNESKKKLNIKFGNKRNVVVGGPNLGQRFPVSLYAPSWLVLLDNAEEIRAFIEENKNDLDWGD
jgi:hypothetical protein